MSNSSSPAPPSSQAQKKRKSSHSSPTSNKAQQNALNTSNGATSPRSSSRRGSRTDADISPSSGSRSSKSPAAQMPFDFFGSNPSLSGYSFNSLPSLPSMGLLGGEKEKGLHPQQGPEVSHRDVTVTSTTSHPSGMGGSTDNGRLLPSDAPQGNGSRSPTMGSPPSPSSGLPTGLPQARPGASNTPSAGPMPPQSQTQTQPQPPLSQPQPQQQPPPPQSQTQPQPPLPTGAPSSPQGAAAVSSPPQSSSGGSPGMNALVAQNNNRRIINPVTVPNGQNFVDITEYLNMPQSEAAKKLSIPPSTLSKRWKEAVRNRKWPWRVVCKLDKEIMTLLHNVPQGAPIPEEIEGRLGYLMRKRQDELKPVVIRL